MISVRRRLGALGCAAVAATALLTAPTLADHPAGAVAPRTARTQPATSTASTYVGYALSRRVCPLPKNPALFTCMAYEATDVPKGTPGARRYSIPRWARGPAGGYTPAAIARAYGFNPKAGGKGQVVGIVDWNSHPHVRADLNHFDRHYGLPAESARSFRVVNQQGAAHPLPAPDRDASVEISLDVEAVRAVCRHCRIVLVEAKAGRSADLAAAENTAVRLGATVVSNSFGSPEPRHHSYPAKIVNAFKHRGVVITASSGDDGYFFWDLANDDPFGFGSYAPNTPSFPASMRNVVSVGGTRLVMNANGTRNSETVWNSNGASDKVGNSRGTQGAAGGGCSTRFWAPTWQRALSGYRAAGCSGKRLSVDVSAVADPATGFSVFDSYGLHGWGRIGGTSLSSPLIAGMWALAGGAHGLAAPAKVLYQNNRFRKRLINDVTVGGNGWCGGDSTQKCSTASYSFGSHNPNRVYDARVDCSFPRNGSGSPAPAKSTACNAAVGYDGPSGVGTPRGLSLFHTTSPSAAIGVSSPRHPHSRITFTAHGHAVLAGTRIVSQKWSWGDHTAGGSGHAPHHRYSHAGRYTVSLTVTDSKGQSTTVSRAITVQ